MAAVDIKGSKSYAPLVKHVYYNKGEVLEDSFENGIEAYMYKRLLAHALSSVLQVVGRSKRDIKRIGLVSRQTKLTEFYCIVKYEYVPVSKRYDDKRGLSERLLRKRLEKQGWTVWRGGLMNILSKDEIYPNVEKKYKLLFSLLERDYGGCVDQLKFICRVHHGMPDFICYRNGLFKFVECKLQYECLSRKQKRCISKLQALGFKVEVHKLVDHRTKIRETEVDLKNMEKAIRVKQGMVRSYK